MLINLKMDMGGWMLALSLTHIPQDKMAAILADDIFNCIFFYENDRIQIKFHWNMFTEVQLTITQHWFR